MLQQYGPSGEKNFRFAKSVRKRLHADEFATEWPSVLIYTTVSGVNTAILLRGEGSDECGGLGGRVRGWNHIQAVNQGLRNALRH